MTGQQAKSDHGKPSAEQQGELDRLLDLDRHKLSVIPKKKATGSERWMKYLGFPLGMIVFLTIYYMETPAGLSASGQAVLASFAMALTA